MKQLHTTVAVVMLAAFALWGAHYIFRTSVVVDGDRVFLLWDDMMIAMQYAENFRNGHGMVWMADGERSQGFVDLAMVAAMIGIHYLPISPTRTALAVQIIGLVAMLGVLALVWRTCRRLVPEHAIVAHAALLATAVSAPLAVWSLQGSDVGLMALWGVAPIWLLARSGTAADRSWPTGLTALLSVGVLIRPDAAIPACAVLGVAALRADHPPRRLAVGMATLFAVAAAVLVFQRLYWGDWMPLPYHHKVTGSPKILVLQKGLSSASVWLAPLAPALVLAGLGVWRTRRQTAVLACAAILPLAAAYDVWVGGDWQPQSGSRFVVPWLPMLMILSALGAWTVVRKLPARWTTKAISSAFVAALTLLVALVSNPGRTEAEWLTMSDEPMKRGKNERNLLRALYFRDHTEPGTTLALHFAGVPGYFSERPAIDVFGRTNAYIAKLEVDRFIPAHSKWDWDYLMTKAPDIFLIASRGLGERDDFRRLYYRAIYPSPGKGAPFYVRKTSVHRLTDPNVVLTDQASGEETRPERSAFE